MNKLMAVMMVFLSLAVHANDRPVHQKNNINQKQQPSKRIARPGYCEIEIINPTRFPVRVQGKYLDGDYLQPFEIYPNQPAQFIVLNYYGCMPGMTLTITGLDGFIYLDGYVAVNSTISVPQRYTKKLTKVKVQLRQ